MKIAVILYLAFLGLIIFAEIKGIAEQKKRQRSKNIKVIDRIEL